MQVGIAERRHHRERLMRKRRFHWGRDLSREPEILARVVNTPKPCSCAMCGNTRWWAGETMQEAKMTGAED